MQLLLNLFKGPSEKGTVY